MSANRLLSSFTVIEIKLLCLSCGEKSSESQMIILLNSNSVRSTPNVTRPRRLLHSGTRAYIACCDRMIYLTEEI